MKWYYEAQGEQQGPVTEEAIQALFTSGVIEASTKVWRKGLADWLPASEVLSEGPQEPSPAPTADGPRVYEPHDRDQMTREERVHAFMHGLPLGYQGGDDGWVGVMHFKVHGGPSYTVTCRDGGCEVYDGLVGEPTCTVTCDSLEPLVNLANSEPDSELSDALEQGIIEVDHDGELLMFDVCFLTHRVSVETVLVPEYHVLVPVDGGDQEALRRVLQELWPGLTEAEVREELDSPRFSGNRLQVSLGLSREQVPEVAARLEATGRRTETLSTSELYKLQDSDPVFQEHLKQVRDKWMAENFGEDEEGSIPWAWIGGGIIVLIHLIRSC